MYSNEIITVRVRAFNGKLETVQCIVNNDGTVRVFDDIAGFYSACHSLSERQQSRIRNLAS